MSRRTLTLLVAAAITACGTPEEVPEAGSSRGSEQRDSGNFTNRVYERNFVFASVAGDSAFIVPWMMLTIEQPDTVRREARAWLTRGGVWDGFYSERWFTPPTRAAARIQPHAGMRLLVRDGDAIDAVLFDDGSRSLEVILGEVEASWTGARGGSFEVLSGAAYLADQSVEGFVLDMSRASAGASSPGGDWAFLLSGDSAQFVFAADAEYGGEVEPRYRGWGASAAGPLQWAEVRVDWERTQAFPPARRDVPVQWRVWSSDALVDGDLEAISAEIQPGEGPDPLLPVRAIYEVRGELSTVRGVFPVHGVLVHERR